jgi:hypothetical protein
MAAWPTLKEVRSILGKVDTNDDALIDSARLAAIDYGMGKTAGRWPLDSDMVPECVHEACLLDSSRIYRRRDSLDGTIGWGDAGLVRVGRADPDVERLYSLVAYMVFG